MPGLSDFGAADRGQGKALRTACGNTFSSEGWWVQSDGDAGGIVEVQPV